MSRSRMSPEQRNTVRRIRRGKCPVCGEREIYVHPPLPARILKASMRVSFPLPHAFSWVAGCQSTTCDSTWRVVAEDPGVVETILKTCRSDLPL